MKKYWPIFISSMAIIAFILVYLFLDKAPRKFYVNSIFKGIYVDKSKYPITGIDLSKHSGIINFDKIKTQQIDFVYLKATEGITLKDRTFERNYKNAKKHGFPVGVYHFLKFSKNGKTQALHFLNHIRGKSFELPLVLDVESWGNMRKHDPKKITETVKNFILEVKKARPENIVIYTNENGYNTYIKGEIDADLWICSFNEQPNLDKNWLFWQHIHDKNMKGVEGFVDLNTFNGSKADWKAFLAQQPKY